MAFFTRVNTNIPFLPNDQNQIEELAVTSKDDKKQSYSSNNGNEVIRRNDSDAQSPSSSSSTSPIDSKKDSTRYDYVVDRVLGVEV